MDFKTPLSELRQKVGLHDEVQHLREEGLSRRRMQRCPECDMQDLSQGQNEEDLIALPSGCHWVDPSEWSSGPALVGVAAVRSRSPHDGHGRRARRSDSPGGSLRAPPLPFHPDPRPCRSGDGHMPEIRVATS